MAYLNHVLWLKCRLSARTISARPGDALGLVLFFFSVVFLVAPASVGVFLLVTSRPAEQGRFLVHLILSGIYIAWLAVPILGYRVNEAFDITKLFVFPVAYSSLAVSTFVGSFLDAATLLLLPFLVVVALACSGGWWGIVPALSVVVVLLFHTVTLSRFVVFALRQVLNRRRFWEIVLVVLPVIVFLVFFLAQSFMIAVDSGALPSFVVGDFDLLVFSSYFPPGIAAEALVSLRDSNTAAAVYWSGTLLACTFLTLAVSAFISNKIVKGEYDHLSGARDKPSSSQQRGAGFLFPVLRKITGDTPMAAVAARDFRLLFREPHYRMIMLLFPLLSIGMLFALIYVEEADVRASIVEFLSISSIFFFGGLFTNNLAIERSGLKLSFAAPLDSFHLLWAKNLGTCFVVGCCVIVPLLLAGLVADLPLSLFFCNIVVCLTVMLVMAGGGNIVSVVCPIPLPGATMVSTRKKIGFGRLVLLSLWNMLILSMTMFLVLPVLIVLFSAAAMDQWIALAWLIPPCALYIVGIWGILTLLSATLLERRREELLSEILD